MHVGAADLHAIEASAVNDRHLVITRPSTWRCAAAAPAKDELFDCIEVFYTSSAGSAIDYISPAEYERTTVVRQARSLMVHQADQHRTWSQRSWPSPLGERPGEILRRFVLGEEERLTSLGGALSREACILTPRRATYCSFPVAEFARSGNRASARIAA